MKNLKQKILSLSEKATSLPCGGQCTYPICNDEVTNNGENCMERILNEIKQLCK